jgi:hypothetical protein
MVFLIIPYPPKRFVKVRSLLSLSTLTNRLKIFFALSLTVSRGTILSLKLKMNILCAN